MRADITRKMTKEERIQLELERELLFKKHKFVNMHTRQNLPLPSPPVSIARVIVLAAKYLSIITAGYILYTIWR